jgi:hypothetical protein
MQDDVEREYVREINRAMAEGDNDRAYDLAVGLRQYRESYKMVWDR